jgi:hypothetical protein
MPSVPDTDPQQEAGRRATLEDMRLRIATGQSFGIMLVGNRVSLRWHLHGQMVQVGMLVAEVITPADAARRACCCCGETEAAFLRVSVRADGAARPEDVICANCELARSRYGTCPHQAAAGRVVGVAAVPPDA